jgi:hypothetical protein
VRHMEVDLKQVHDHIPLSTVTNQVTGQVIDEAVVERPVSKLDSQLEVVIGLVQLIPEEEVGL